MADDQNVKTMDINDLVRELSKGSTSPATPPVSTERQVPVPQAANRPPFSAPKPSAPPQMSSSLPVSPSAVSIPKSSVPTTPIQPLTTPRPEFNATPPPLSQLPIQSKQSLGTESRILDSSAKPDGLGRIGTKPVVVPPMPSTTPTPGVKEYQSSIRTMSEDISKIKQGQKPVGVDIPRKVEQVVPTPQPIVPKPVVPGPQFKVPNVNLGEAQKTGPLAQSKNFSIPSKSVPSSVPVVPKVEPKSQIYVPQEGPKGGNRNMLFMGIGALVLVAGFSYWFFVLRLPAPEVVVETPTPSPTATPVQNLNTIFADLREIEPLEKINGGELRKDSQVLSTPGLNNKLLDSIYGTKYPVEMNSVLGNDALFIWYGQKEIFDDKGQIKIGIEPERQLVVISEIVNITLAPQVLSSWEVSMSEDLRFFFITDQTPGYKGGNVAVDFMDNFYRD